MTRPPEHPALVADIGGTNVRFGIATASGEIQGVSSLVCADFPSLTEAAQAYLETVAGPPPKWAAFAIAGPVQGDTIRMTNHVWSFSGRAVRRDLALERLELLNDFAALALAIPALTAADLVEIRSGTPADRAPKAVLGPGTGLGVAALVPAGDSWTALTTEGGHRDLAAQNEREWQVVRHLGERFEHVSVERVLSGPGLVNLYEAVSRLADEEPQSLTPAAVVAGARDRSSAACVEATNLFSSWLGAVASDLALTLGAFGGVYLGGGILPKMGEVFDADRFASVFSPKGDSVTICDRFRWPSSPGPTPPFWVPPARSAADRVPYILAAVVLALAGVAAAASGEAASPSPPPASSPSASRCSNQYQGSAEFRAELSLTNRSAVPLAGDWQLYFNFGRPLRAESAAHGVAVAQVNGDLLRLSPTASFAPLAPGEERRIGLLGRGAVTRRSDAPAGPYFVFGDGRAEAVGDYTIAPFRDVEGLRRAVRRPGARGHGGGPVRAQPRSHAAAGGAGRPDRADAAAARGERRRDPSRPGLAGPPLAGARARSGLSGRRPRAPPRAAARDHRGRPGVRRRVHPAAGAARRRRRAAPLRRRGLSALVDRTPASRSSAATRPASSTASRTLTALAADRRPGQKRSP